MKCGWLLLALSAFTAPAFAQSFVPFSCTADATNINVRAEGKTELVADVVVSCTGGFPTFSGDTVPTADLVLTFNAPVTSRILGSGNLSEALLLIDEPKTGVQNPCTAAPCPATGTALPSFAVAGKVSARTTQFSGNPNVFQGVVAAPVFFPETSFSLPGDPNSITWFGVPIDQPGTGGTRTFRFTNIRLDASAVTGGTLQLTSITPRDVESFPTITGPITVGTVRTSLSANVRDAASATAAPNGVTFPLATAGSSATRVSTLRYSALFFGADRPRTIAPFVNSDTSPAPVAQSSPGSFYNSESGFYNPAFPAGPPGNLNLAGLADWGTRLMATFTNVPAGVRIYVSLRNDGVSLINTPVARLTATDANGGGPFSPVASSLSIAPLTVSGGTATAVWEVLRNGSSTDAYDFGVYFAYDPNILPAPPPVNVTMRYAPFNIAGEPVFTGITASQRLVSFTATTPPPIISTPQLSLSPGNLAFTGTAGAPNIPAQTLSVVSSSTSVGFSASSTGTIPLVFQPSGGSTPGSVRVSVNAGKLPPGTYRDIITVSAADPIIPVQIPVTLTLTAGPSITSITPSSALAGSPAFTLTVNGTLLTATTVVAWNGAPLATSFVNAGQLTASVPASLVATAGQASVTAVTGDGAVSNSLPFTILPFRLTSIDPATVSAGGPDFTLTATGTGFVQGARLIVGGASLQPASFSPTQITATVPAAAIAQAGPVTVTVLNGGGVSSNALTLTVTPVLRLTSLNPAAVTATGPSFVLNLTGIGFVTGATVQLGSQTLTPTSVSATQIAVAVPAIAIAQPLDIAVRVVNPGNLQSNTLTLTVNPAPRITSIDPSSTTAGAPAFTLTVAGTNLRGSVTWDGAPLQTTAVSATELTAQVPANLVAAAGTASVGITTADAVASNSLPFTILPQPSITALSPSSANVGSGAFTLAVTGTNLRQGMQVAWGGQPLTTAFVSATQLTAQVPATLLAAAGTANVTALAGAFATNALPFRILLPPPPTVTITAPATAASGQNQTVTLTLGGTFPLDLIGTLTLTFIGDAGLPDDPAIQFQNGRRVITFNVPAGTQPQIPPAVFQTGTLAGTITVTLTFTTAAGADVTPGAPPQRVQVSRAAPTISAVTCSRNSSGFTVVIDGFTNTREATQATFDFSAASGASLGTSQLVLTTSQLFTGWFGSAGASASGGLFRYTQPFTVQGTSTTVASLTVRLANSAGTSSPASCQLQ